jgi:hypothetical protein
VVNWVNLIKKGENMSTNKYDKYIVPAPIMFSKFFPIKYPQINVGSTTLNGIPFTMNWSCLTEPFVMVEKAHSHEFDQVICFIGGDSRDIREFGGEIWFYFGEEEEKHVITSPSYICVPRGTIHAPLIVKKIDKPIMYMDFPLTGQYVKKEAETKKS